LTPNRYAISEASTHAHAQLLSRKTEGSLDQTELHLNGNNFEHPEEDHDEGRSELVCHVPPRANHIPSNQHWHEGMRKDQSMLRGHMEQV